MPARRPGRGRCRSRRGASLAVDEHLALRGVGVRVVRQVGLLADDLVELEPIEQSAAENHPVLRDAVELDGAEAEAGTGVGSEVEGGGR